MQPFRPEGPTGVFQPRPGLGDLIWHLPLIRAIAARTESGRVTLITKPSTQADALLGHDPVIGPILWFDRQPRVGRGRHDGVGYFRLVAELRRAGLGSCVLLHHSTALAAAMALAGIPGRYGYGYGGQRYWLTRPPWLAEPPGGTEAFEQAAAYAAACGLGDALPEPCVTVPPGGREALAARIADWAAPIAVLGIGCAGVARQWASERFGGLARGLLDRGMGTVGLLGSAGEGGLAREIAAAAGDGRVRLALGWKLAEVAALLEGAAVFVGNDSGPLNLRAALGRPAYGLFGASGPLRHSAMIRPIVPREGPRTGMGGIALGDVLGAVDGGETSRFRCLFR